MLSEDTSDCLALANTAILMRLVDELIERGAISRATTIFEDAVATCKAALSAALVSMMRSDSFAGS